MPVSDDLHPRSFLTKITHYTKVVNVPNSISILHDLLPVALDLTKKERKGVYNFVNPGTITHNRMLELYKEVSVQEHHKLALTKTLAVHKPVFRLGKLFFGGTEQSAEGWALKQRTSKRFFLFDR